MDGMSRKLQIGQTKAREATTSKQSLRNVSKGMSRTTSVCAITKTNGLFFVALQKKDCVFFVSSSQPSICSVS
jgi:hypothetical protein